MKSKENEKVARAVLAGLLASDIPVKELHALALQFLEDPELVMAVSQALRAATMALDQERLEHPVDADPRLRQEATRALLEFFHLNRLNKTQAISYMRRLLNDRSWVPNPSRSLSDIVTFFVSRAPNTVLAAAAVELPAKRGMDPFLEGIIERKSGKQ